MLGATLFHVDVFATGPLTGNGLAVFLATESWSTSVMQRLTREMNQFESIFLSHVNADSATARVFTVEEELPFAGHPVLGAAAVLHRTQSPQAERRSWTLTLPHGNLAVSTQRLDDHYACEMNQGAALFTNNIAEAPLKPILDRFSLDETDMAPGAPAQVVSTGLPYLILPVQSAGLARASIRGSDLESRLAKIGAKFVFLLDIEQREIRTWDNLGRVEDVATGSAAGPAAAYLLRYGFADRNQPIHFAQGRFAGRPSRLTVITNKDDELLVSGEVWPVSHGVLDIDPTSASL